MESNSIAEEYKYRRSVSSNTPDIFTKIYEEDVNIAIWQNTLSKDVQSSALKLVQQKPNLKAVITVTPDKALQLLTEHLPNIDGINELCQQITLMVDMFCTLFEIQQAGLRLIVLDRPMCPRFHVDKVPCRLITTLAGDSTQWLDNNDTDRTKLGAGNKGLSDDESDLFQDSQDINDLSTGDIALLKGEGWFDNGGGGVVHRSPNYNKNERRLLLTLDFIN